MKSVNRVTLMGAVGKDPEIRYTQSGMAVANFSLATSRKQKDKTEVTQWHNLVSFGKTADLVREYVTKGSKLYVEGEIQYQEYEKDGEKRYATKVIVNDMSFLGDSQNKAAPKAAPEPTHSEEIDDDSVPF